MEQSLIESDPHSPESEGVWATAGEMRQDSALMRKRKSENPIGMPEPCGGQRHYVASGEDRAEFPTRAIKPPVEYRVAVG